MGRPKAKGEKSEVDEMMDEALGEADANLDEGPGAVMAEAATETPEPEREKPSAPERTQPASEAAVDSAPVEAVAPEESAIEKERSLREASDRANAALRRELVEMRAKVRAGAEKSHYAPNPAQQPTASTPPEAPKPLRGEDLIQFRDGQIGLDVDRIREMVRNEARQATMPDPEDMRRQRAVSEYNTLKDEFIRENPAINSQAMQHVEHAYEFLTLSTAAKAQEWGVPLERLNFDGRMDFLRTSGVMDEVAKRFPHLAPELPELLRADALESREGMRTVLRRYSEQLGSVLGGAPAAPATQPSTPQSRPVYQPPTNAPPNLAKVGTSTPEPVRADKERLSELEKMDAADPLFGMSKGEIKELERLRAKFDKQDLPWGVGAGGQS